MAREQASEKSLQSRNTTLASGRPLAASAFGLLTNNRYASLMRNRYDLLEVGNIVLGVADALYIDSFCFVVDGGLEVLCVVAIYEFRLDA